MFLTAVSILAEGHPLPLGPPHTDVICAGHLLTVDLSAGGVPLSVITPGLLMTGLRPPRSGLLGRYLYGKNNFSSPSWVTTKMAINQEVVTQLSKSPEQQICLLYLY